MRVEIAGVRHHKCDWCKRDFTDECAEHMSIKVGKRSGYSALSERLPGWRFFRIIKKVQLDFCIPQSADNCIGKFFAGVGDSPEYVI